jgi:hypothetical protein
MAGIKRSLCCLGAVLAVSGGTPSGGAPAGAAPVADPNALLQKAIVALRTLEPPATGRGRARMTLKDAVTEYVETEVVADFVFKGRSARTDIFVREASGRLSRLYCEVGGEKVGMRVYRDRVFVEGADYHDRRIGYDFSPRRFIDITGHPVHPITEYLEFALREPDALRSVELDDKGILHSLGSTAERRPSGKPRAVDKLWLDTQKGFLPVYYESLYNDADGTWGAQTVRLEWARYNGVWYVSRVERDSPPSHQVRCIFTVESFTPNAEVGDREFTLDGLGLPEGLPIEDDTAGHARYLYRPPDDFKPAAQTVRRSAEPPSAAVAPRQELPPADANRRADGPAGVAPAEQTSVGAGWIFWAGLMGAVVVGGAIGYLARRRGGGG